MNETIIKHAPPKFVTELGIVIEVKPVQPRKQTSPKLVTVLGIVTFHRNYYFIDGLLKVGSINSHRKNLQ